MSPTRARAGASSPGAQRGPSSRGSSRPATHLAENANDSLKGRVLELSLADLNKDEEQAFRKIKLRVDEVSGKSCLTNFYGMDITTDKLRSLVKKWQTLIEAHVDGQSSDLASSQKSWDLLGVSPDAG